METEIPLDRPLYSFGPSHLCVAVAHAPITTLRLHARYGQSGCLVIHVLQDPRAKKEYRNAQLWLGVCLLFGSYSAAAKSRQYINHMSHCTDHTLGPDHKHRAL